MAQAIGARVLEYFLEPKDPFCASKVQKREFLAVWW